MNSTRSIYPPTVLHPFLLTHIPHLQPHLRSTNHQARVLILPRPTHTLPIRHRPHDLRRMPIVWELASTPKQALPGRIRAGALWRVGVHFIGEQGGRAPGCVHAEIQADFPLEQLALRGGGEPGELQEGAEE